MAPRRPTGTGRKKIEIQRIEGEEARQVSFSKRRTGLFNKARELAILCNLEVAAVAISPSGTKAFSFGHPSVDSVLERFLPSNSPEAQAVAPVGGGAGDPNPALAELNRQQHQLLAQLDTEKARKEAMKEVSAKERAEGCQAAAWVNTEVSQMGEEELVAFDAALAKMEAAVAAHANQVLQEAVHVGHMVHGGGGGFELGIGGTQATSGMEMMQQQQEMAMVMPTLTGFAAGMEMMPTLTGFAAGMEMMPMSMQQQQQMVVPMPPGISGGMGMVPHQCFGPHGFPQ